MLKNETLKTIESRRSCRGFLPSQISDDLLQAVLDAGSCAPYANEERHFSVVQNEALLDRMSVDAKHLAAAIPGLDQLASDLDWHIFYEAPTVVLICGRTDGIAVESDCAAAAQNMLLAAESIGLGGCYIGIVGILFGGGPLTEEYSRQLGIPEGFKPYACTALGHRSTEPAASPRRRATITYVK